MTETILPRIVVAASPWKQKHASAVYAPPRASSETLELRRWTTDDGRTLYLAGQNSP